MLSESVKVKVKKRRPTATLATYDTYARRLADWPAAVASKNINTGHLELQIGPKDSPWSGEDKRKPRRSIKRKKAHSPDRTMDLIITNDVL